MPPPLYRSSAPFAASISPWRNGRSRPNLGRANVTVDEAESPLAWLARRRGRDGRALIEPHQLQAGERLRADFTRAHLMPRTTSNWASPISSGRRGGGTAIAPMLHRNDDRGAPARASGARRGRAGIRGLAARCLLFPQRPRRYRTRARLAGALGQGRAATRARPARASLRLCGAGEGPGARADPHLARRWRGFQCR